MCDIVVIIPNMTISTTVCILAIVTHYHHQQWSYMVWYCCVKNAVSTPPPKKKGWDPFGKARWCGVNSPHIHQSPCLAQLWDQIQGFCLSSVLPAWKVHQILQVWSFWHPHSEDSECLWCKKSWNQTGRSGIAFQSPEWMRAFSGILILQYVLCACNRYDIDQAW